MSREKGVMGRDAMRSPSSSLIRLRNEDCDPYISLANAIICVAADDYRTALRDGDEFLLLSLKRFFRSAWCGILTNVDTEYIMSALDAEYKSAV